MLSKEQANTATDSFIQARERQLLLKKAGARTQRSKPVLGLVVGSSFGGVLGVLVCHLMTNHIQPGLTIGQGFGAGLGVLIGLFVDGKTSKRSRFLSTIAAIAMLVIGALPFVLMHLMR